MEQRTPEWFAARRNRVTASSVGGILSLSPITTRAAVLRSMVRESLGAPSEFPDPAPPPVAWGTAMESTALGEFEMRTGATVIPIGFVPLEDWAGASPDGLIGVDEGVEVKCPYGLRDEPHPTFRTLAEQPHYEAQVQFTLYVTGRKRWHFTQWTPHGHLDEVVSADMAWQRDNVPRLRQFWAEFCDALKEPDEHLQDARRTIDTPTAHKMVAEYDQLSEAIENATERRKDLLAEIVTAAGGVNAVFGGRKLTQTNRVGSVSYAKAIAKYAPDADLEPFRGKPTSFWGLK